MRKIPRRTKGCMVHAVSMGLIIAILITIVNPSIVLAKDSEGSEIIYAHDASYEAVLLAVRSASNGDIVRVPQGESDWGYKNILTIDRSISLQGCGDDKTKIINSLIHVNAANVNIDGFTFVTDRNASEISGGHSGGRITVNGEAENFRIHNNHFLTNLGRPIDVYEAYGLIDNNVFEFKGNSNELIHVYGPKDSWSTPSTFGTAEAVYIEDNLFTTTEGFGSTQCVTGSFNSRFVFRENTVYNAKVDGHGLWSNGSQNHYGDWDYYQQHSVRHYEIYNNDFRTTQKAYWFYFIELRGGTGIVFNNEFSGQSYYEDSPSVALREYLLWHNDGNAVEPGKFMDPSYYPAHDQLGRGMNQTLEPLYLWNNTINGKWYETKVSGPETDPEKRAIIQYGAEFTGQDIVQRNRDYYEYTENFDGTKGVGVGTLSERPVTCTAGVGYFATDQNTLYKATADNTWTAGYTPYVYPHPLNTNSAEPAIDADAKPSTDPMPWNAEVHFSSEQGKNDWYYLEWDGSAYADMTYQSNRGAWVGDKGASVSKDVMQPSDKSDAVREWRATCEGTVDITGIVRKSNGNTNGDGLLLTITKNDEIIWGPQLIDGAELEGEEHSNRVDVKSGDRIRFIANRNKQHWNDAIYWSPTVTLITSAEPVPGDMNGDGLVTIVDLAYVARYIDMTNVDDGWESIKKADMNNDDKINIVDLSAVARLIR